MNLALPARLRLWRTKSSAPSDSGGPQRAALRLPALAPLYRPAGLAWRWLAHALDLALSLIFTFGWATGVLLFVFLLDTLLNLKIWGHLRYGQSTALTAGLFIGLFALPYMGYFIVSLHRSGRTAGFLFTQLRMIRKGEVPSPGIGRERTFGRLGLHRAFVAALPALLAGVVALSFLPQATDRSMSVGFLNAVRLPMGASLVFFILTQFVDRLLRREMTLGIHERLAGVRVVREPRMRELMERERRVTETHIAGGMAHEIRNALGTARLQLDRLANPDLSVRTQRSLEDILKPIAQSSERGQDRGSLKRAVAGVRQIHEDAKLLQRAFQEVSAAVDRGLRITRRVMDYSRIQPLGPAGADHGMLVDPIDPNRLATELADSYREAFERERIRIEMELGATRPIRANAGHCYSMLQNLLLNARDAIREKWKGAGPAGGPAGTIRISTGDGDRIWMRFADDGVGIPPAQLERIFDPFYSTKPSQGMGLGLNECRRIADLYGGEIWVESDTGLGTQVTVLWPAAEPAQETSARRAAGGES